MSFHLSPLQSSNVREHFIIFWAKLPSAEVEILVEPKSGVGTLTQRGVRQIVKAKSVQRLQPSEGLLGELLDFGPANIQFSKVCQIFEGAALEASKGVA